MFSGTGALGLEALSRGAKKVIFLEKNRDLYERLKTLIEKLSLSERAKVIHADSIMYSYEKLNLEFDIIFLDPPFRKGLLNTVYNSLCKNKLFGKDSLIYVEAEEDLELSFMLWKEIKKTKVGQTQFVLYKNEG
jgi:16S rRNA (guanine966-N2)-methyltransferase